MVGLHTTGYRLPTDNPLIMAKKNFTDSLMGSNRSKKLDMLVSGNSAKSDTSGEAEVKNPVKETATAKKSQEEAKEKETTNSSKSTPKAKTEAAPKKKRGRKKSDVEKDSFFYTVEKDFLFEVRAAAFWDRRDISEFITLSLKRYMYEEMGESEIRRAVREYKKRLEE